MPSRPRIWVTASREERSMSPRARRRGLGVAVEDAAGRRGLDADDRDVVSDDVVQLAGDAQPLVGDGAAAQGVALGARWCSACSASRARLPGAAPGAWPTEHGAAEVDDVDEQGQQRRRPARGRGSRRAPCRRVRRARPGSPSRRRTAGRPRRTCEHDRADDADHQPPVARPRDAREDRDEVDELEGELAHHRRHGQADDEHVGRGEGGDGQRPATAADEEGGPGRRTASHCTAHG